GRLGVRKKGPYEYLVYSLRVFPHQLEILEIFREAGLRSPRVYELTGGIVAVHMGTV
ncbi:MAG: class I SAM-dependent methyltransferase, partial [Clostridia bacterium]|nr:class I SAM-dependent methyltransferase [Clostridia bacterium]